MSDARRREAERRAGEGEDAAPRLLVERMRAGELAPDRVALAAYLGDPASALALGAPPPGEDASPRDWARELARFGREAEVRAAIAVAWALLPDWEALSDDEVAPGLLPRVRRAIEAAQAWALAPDPDAEARALRASNEARLAATHAPAHSRGMVAGFVGAMAANAADSATYAYHNATTHYASSCFEQACELLGRDVAHATVARELVPWALGVGDPVRERASVQRRA